MTATENRAEHPDAELRDASAPREVFVSALLQAVPADWTDLAVAVTAAYQHRMTAAHDLVLAVDSGPVRLTVEPTTTVAGLVAQVRDLRGRAGESAQPGDDAPPVSAQVFLADDAAPVEGLAFAFAHREGVLWAEAKGDPGRFTHEHLAEHTSRIGHFAERLFGAGPAAEVGEVDLLTPAEHHRIMHEWNATAHEVPQLTLPELVEANVAAHPDRLAISHYDERLTYAELDRRANRIARLLIGRGAGAGDIVAMVLPRSIDYVVTALAIVKTGAAYLPVDTGYPVERINQVLSDAGVSHTVTIAALSDSVLVAAEQIVLDQESTRTRLAAADPSAPADTDRRAPLTPDAPAYVLYTSGSTGRPKGVVVAHRAITNRLHHMQHQIPLGPDDRLLQKTPAGFDVTVREVFWPLLAGASIVVADPDGHRDPAYLAETIVAENITITHFVPSGLKVFLQEPDAAKCVSLRRVVCGGEALPAELQAWFASVLEADLYNVYGPTEAAVDVTSMLCPRNPEPGPVLIGRPVWNTWLYVLDEQRRMLPPGVTGELYLAGVQLAEGYLGRPELTAERFISDPFGEPGARMYRSGDAARWRADGVIEFFGRLDHQVKIRGFRVELEEIESVLLRDGQLSQAVCLVREDVPGDQRLVAYLVPVTGTDPDIDKLRAQAVAALPDYMVPTAFVVLDQLPLTSNEKLDRKALPKPEAQVTPVGREPSTPEELLVAGLFAELLGVSSVGAEQDFVELGGNSLLISRLINEIHKRSGVRLRIKKILEDPSVQAIAALITA
ncbi:non-ribosomal peptide synthetase adenylation domain protein [Streptomyces lydicamycinicus]|uniref:Non-ribosomal peptide synthetase adenylation domain protein n=1 Tax=Streptomyces lydicamycinicus TaxID=1546107 RepID=A0A0P4RDN9_9ACTN|nr:amino acid adenylation domain-containing protein [Streptomyces lydicamycinicus]GAO11278.1 non-ribosomal peptide synthetase adenylation domain protein [Streptomyces lydicamycinicus]